MTFYIITLGEAVAVTKFLATSSPVTFTFMLFGIMLIGWVVKHAHVPWWMLGLTLVNTRISLIYAILGTIPFALLAILLKYTAIQWVPQLYGTPLFDIAGMIKQLGGLEGYIIGALAYVLIVAPLQELTCRGFLQGMLQQVFWGERSIWGPILVSNLFFAQMHLAISVTAAVLAFFPGLLWGWIFAKYNNLIGISIAHGLAGLFVFFVVGYSYFFA